MTKENSIIRKLAFLKAQADGYKQSSEYYWCAAEQDWDRVILATLGVRLINQTKSLKDHVINIEVDCYSNSNYCDQNFY